MPKLADRLKAVQQTHDQAVLVRALGDPSPHVVAAAAKRIADPAAAGALLAAYLRLHAGGAASDAGCWGRQALLEALGRLDVPEAEDAARLALRTVQVERTDTATGLRALGALLLANRRAPGLLVDLALLLFDIEPDAPCAPQDTLYVKAAVRVAAAKAIGTLGDLGGTAVLAVKLAFQRDDLPEVLAECIDALAFLQEPRTLELLAPWLQHGDPYLVSVAATAMAKADGKQAAPLLESALSTVVADAKEPLVYALASIRDDAGAAALQRLTTHADPAIRKAAASVLRPQ